MIMVGQIFPTPKTDLSWHERAKCRDAEIGTYDETDIRMNDRERLLYREFVRHACDGCPVIRQCAADALEFPRLASHVIRAGTIASTTKTFPRRAALEHWRKIVAEHG